MYSKTISRVKIRNLLSSLHTETHGVNQGGVSSPFLFKAFHKDLNDFLSTQCGILAQDDRDTIIRHLLWADDLNLLAESEEELQILFNNVFEFCKKWQLIVNEIKTKVMIYNSKHVEVKITYNNETVEVVENYKYVGMLFSSKSGILQDHLQYTEQCANKAIFALKKKLKPLKQTPPLITIKLFDSLVHPILEYGSEIWYPCTKSENLETLHLRFLKKNTWYSPSDNNSSSVW